MTVAKLFVLGTERELLWTDLEYYRFLNSKTGRCGEIPMGGLVTLAFASGWEDDRLLRWITHSEKDELCKLTEGKIVFYKGNFDGVILFEYKFKDAALIYWKEIFTTVGEEPMTITMTISAAIQQVKGVTLVKPWQESWVTPSEQMPYQAVENDQKKEAIEITNIDGPFDKTGNKIKYISPKHTYYYHATIKNYKEGDDLNQIQWSVTYDDEDTAKHQKLITGGTYKDGILKTQIQVSKGKHTATIYAHIDNLNPNINTKATYKQVVTFFIGGAGDKEPFYGSGATKIMEGVRINFNKKIKSKLVNNDLYTSYYLGYNEVKGENNIKNNILSQLPNKDGTQINIVGHSLGGWNGAHLSDILTQKGYIINTLITLDPVGEGGGVTTISDIHLLFPSPKAGFWVYIHTDPENYRADDLIADLGGQWIPRKNKPHVIHTTIYNHGKANNMFNEILSKTTISASSLLLSTIQKFLDSKL